MTEPVLETLAAALLGFFTVGYFVLGGADIGLGMLLPYLGRSPSRTSAGRSQERRRVIAAIGPFFLGNEVWLIAAAGVFIGCFPDLEGELFQGQSTVLLALLTGWVVRDSGLWWRRHLQSRGFRLLADCLVTGGSWAVALSWGLLLTGVLSGSWDAPAETGIGERVGGLLAVPGALLVAALFAAHGAAFGALRLTGTPYEQAHRLIGRGGRTFTLTALLMGVLPLTAGARLPLAQSAAGGPVLGLLVPTLLLITPLLVAAQMWLWHTFRHRSSVPTFL
jgi:cytochrome bd ubiquinol oxidase subunit II